MNEKNELYFYMVIGIIGPLLVASSAIEYIIEKGSNTLEYFLVFFGFMLTINYINFLEKKAGMSRKFTWTRISVSLVLFAVISIFVWIWQML